MNILQVTTCRPALFWRMLDSLDKAGQLYHWHLQVETQAWPEGEPDRDLPVGMCLQIRRCTVMPEKRSLWQSRIDGLREMRPGDVICFGDDDMIFTAETDYNTPAEFIRRNRHVGVVATQMQRTANSPVEPLSRVYSEWTLPGVMGGMLIGYDAAQHVLEWAEKAPGVDYRPDDVHISAACYVAGLTNYMYHGSRCIHEYGTPGGIIDVQRANPWMHAGHPDYFELNKAKKYIAGRQWKLELTAKAHAEHEANAGRWL